MIYDERKARLAGKKGQCSRAYDYRVKRYVFSHHWHEALFVVRKDTLISRDY